LSGPLSETTLNHTTHEINVLFMIFLLAGQSVSAKTLPWVRFYLQKLLDRGLK